MTRSLSVCLSPSAIDNLIITVGKPWDLSPFVIDQLRVIGRQYFLLRTETLRLGPLIMPMSIQ